VALWSGDPLDVLSSVRRAFIDGEEIYTLQDGEARFAEF